MGRRGFTLLEILIVIAILAVLMGMFLGAFQSVIGFIDWENSEIRVRGLGSKIAEIRGLTGRYPADLSELIPAMQQPSWIQGGVFVDAYGRPIQYGVSGRSFRVWSVGRDGVSGNGDDIVFSR